MIITTVTTNGRIVIPLKIRQKFKIRKGTRFCIVEKEDQLILQPLTDEYFEKMAGVLNTKGNVQELFLRSEPRRKNGGEEMAKVLEASVLMTYPEKEPGYEKIKDL